jgi:hypothetical protein
MSREKASPRPSGSARGGANVSELDTPDGMRAAQLKQESRLQDLAKSGSLPPLFDGVHKEPVPLTPDQLAHFYAARHAFRMSAPLTLPPPAE